MVGVLVLEPWPVSRGIWTRVDGHTRCRRSGLEWSCIRSFRRNGIGFLGAGGAVARKEGWGKAGRVHVESFLVTELCH